MSHHKRHHCKCRKEISDYVIVGLGTAGSVLARKLSDDFTKKVTVIESGRNLTTDPVILAPNVFDFDPSTGGPVVDALSTDSKFTKNYPFPYNTFSTLFPSLQTNAALLQSANLAHGQTWGGSSAVNYLLCNHGSPDAWNEWAVVSGNPQWSQANLVPVFESIETFHPDGTDTVTCSQRGTSGEISVKQNPRLAYHISSVTADGAGTLATYQAVDHPYAVNYVISTTGFTVSGFNVLNATVVSVVPSVSFTIAVSVAANATDVNGVVVRQNENIQIGLNTVGKIPMIEDYNSFPTKDIQTDSCITTERGTSPYQQYITTGPNAHRSFAANTYIDNTVVTPNGFGVGGRQLRILSNSTAVRILFEGTKAVGVEYLETGDDNSKKLRRIYAKTKVILCAGGIQTPALLQRSGVGNSTKLNALGVPVVLNQPLVGQGLKSHPGAVVLVDFSVPGSVNNIQTFISSDPNVDRRDAQWLMNFIGAPNFNIGYYFLMNEKSEGSVEIQSRSPFVDPKVRPNYYTNIVKETITGVVGDGTSATYTVSANTYQVGDIITVAMDNSADAAFNLAGDEVTAVTASSFTVASAVNSTGGSGVASLNTDASTMFRCFKIMRDSCSSVGQTILQPSYKSTYSEFLAYISDNTGAITTYHQCKTARMGTDISNSVVDGNLHVHGLSNLMVCDNSVAPRIINGNTCFMAYTIGTVAASILGF